VQKLFEKRQCVDLEINAYKYENMMLYAGFYAIYFLLLMLQLLFFSFPFLVPCSLSAHPPPVFSVIEPGLYFQYMLQQGLLAPPDLSKKKDVPLNFCKQQTYISSIQGQGLKDHHPYIFYGT
jgi:hypothetical protein